jgi:hypothetical protein
VIHPWIAGGEHVFELQPLSPSGTRLNHDEQFFGLTGSLITAFTRARVIRAFNAMNDALKQEAEKPPASSL